MIAIPRNSARLVGALALCSAMAVIAQPSPASTSQATQPPKNAADKPIDKAPATPTRLSTGDRDFLGKAAQDGLAEVELAKLGESKASNGEVKRFAQRMATDHARANDELKSLAGSKGAPLPAQVDARHRSAVARLQDKSGADFDRAYMKQMVDDHQHAVAEFKRAAKGATDADVKGWAEKTLPTLEEHLKLAQATEKAVAARK